MTTLTDAATDRLLALAIDPVVAVVLVLTTILVLTGVAGRVVLAIESLQTEPSSVAVAEPPDQAFASQSR